MIRGMFAAIILTGYHVRCMTLCSRQGEAAVEKQLDPTTSCQDCVLVCQVQRSGGSVGYWV